MGKFGQDIFCTQENCLLRHLWPLSSPTYFFEARTEHQREVK